MNKKELIDKFIKYWEEIPLFYACDYTTEDELRTKEIYEELLEINKSVNK